LVEQKKKLKGVQIANSTHFFKSGGVEKQQELPLDSFATKEFGTVAIGKLRTIVNFKEAPFPIGEESDNVGDIHVEFSCVKCL